MCPTTTGRVHSRVAIVMVFPALLGLILSLVTGNPAWIVIIGIYLVMGVALDTLVYSWLFTYQPPWMTFLLAVVEWGFLLVLVNVIAEASDKIRDVSVLEASLFYWASWLLAIWTKVALLPIYSLTYIESAGEFRRIQWSVPAQSVAVPVLASTEEAKRGPGAVVKEASGVHAKPLEPLPSPSGVHRLPVPPGAPAA